MTAPRPAGPPLARRQAMLDLVVANAWALDAHDLPRYLAAFADDAVFVETAGDGAVSEFAGIAAIEAETARRFTGPVGHQHRMTNHAFVPLPDGRDGWTVHAYWSTTVREPDPAAEAVVLAGSGWLRDEIEFDGEAPRIVRREVGPWGVGEVRHPFGP